MMPYEFRKAFEVQAPRRWFESPLFAIVPGALTIILSALAFVVQGSGYTNEIQDLLNSAVVVASILAVSSFGLAMVFEFARQDRIGKTIQSNLGAFDLGVLVFMAKSQDLQGWQRDAVVTHLNAEYPGWTRLVPVVNPIR